MLAFHEEDKSSKEKRIRKNVGINITKVALINIDSIILNNRNNVNKGQRVILSSINKTSKTFF